MTRFEEGKNFVRNAGRHREPKEIIMKHYVAFDCEYVWDEHLFEAHRAIDTRSERRAIAVKQVIAISAYAFSIADDGQLTIGVHSTWTSHTWGDEAAVIERFCDFLHFRPDHSVIGFGSLAVDLPIVTMAAMAAGLRLPEQLRDCAGRWDKRHVDLGMLMKGRGKTWTHLSQLAIRLGIPASLLAAKSDVPIPTSSEKWVALGDHVTLDALLLALVWSAWLATQGEPGVHYAPCAIAHIGTLLRRQPGHRMAAELAAYQRQLEEDMAAEYELAA